MIAIVDDEPRMARVISMVLRREGHDARTFERGGDLIAAIDDGDVFDVVLTDLKMPGMSGIEVLEAVRDRLPVPVILVTAHATVTTAIEALKKGAFDYVEKPFDNEDCVRVVERAMEHGRLERENRYLRAELRQKYRIEDLVVVSEGMQSVMDLARKAARSRSTVLITGESGTGKEVVARAIHYYSRRVGRPFVATNCKALSAGVLESELFGHEKGAFSGAVARHIGLFERANGGTVLLDEIGEVDQGFQAKLLRVLQERELMRVGGTTPIDVDIRVIAATNRDLRAEADDGTFREDLFYRLAVIPIEIPPLRARRADILPLASYFIERYADEVGRSVVGLTDAAERALVAHPWPGNVRELENTIERAVVLGEDDELGFDDLMLDRRGSSAEPTTVADESLQAYLDRCTIERIRAALEAANGVRGDAADALGIDRTTLYRMMRRLGLS